MTVLGSLAMLTPVLIGFTAVRGFVTQAVSTPASRVIEISIAIGVGFGLTSCLFFLTLAYELPFVLCIIVECVSVILGMLLMKHRSRVRVRRRQFDRYVVRWAESETLGHDSEGTTIHQINTHRGASNRFLALALCLVLSMSAVTLGVTSFNNPLGLEDAWSIWNVRARFIVGSAHWTEALHLAHGGYPLLLPLSVARLWSALGDETPLVPMLLGWAFSAGTVCLLIATVVVLKNPAQGMLAGLAVLAMPFFVRLGSGQSADMPIAYYITSTASLLCIYYHSHRRPRMLLVLAGITAGLTTWTKNEGNLFVLCLVISLLIVFARQKRLGRGLVELRLFFLGLAPILIILALFKFQFAPPTDLVRGLGGRLENLVDPLRYAEVLKAVAELFLYRYLYVGGALLLVFHGLLMGVTVQGSHRNMVRILSLTQWQSCFSIDICTLAEHCCLCSMGC